MCAYNRYAWDHTLPPIPMVMLLRERYLIRLHFWWPKFLPPISLSPVCARQSTEAYQHCVLRVPFHAELKKCPPSPPFSTAGSAKHAVSFFSLSHLWSFSTKLIPRYATLVPHWTYVHKGHFLLGG